MRIATLPALLLLASTLHAQGSIGGVVLDRDHHPVRGADVTLPGHSGRAQTDSSGRFTLANLDAGFYRVRVRRLGYLSTTITTDLGKGGHVDLNFELLARPAILDSVVVRADGRCPDRSFAGFNCRRAGGKGVYLSDDDLAERGAVELGDVFREVPGFRIDVVATQFGAKPRPLATRGARCLNALVNGRPISGAVRLPRYANELLAVEIYAVPNEVPPEYQRFVSQRSIRQSSSPTGQDSPNARCALVVYWTSFA